MNRVVSSLRENFGFWTILLLSGALLFVGGMFVQQRWAPMPSGTGPKSASSVSLRGTVPGWVSRVDRHSADRALGDPGAPVTVTEYTDFQCPYCRRHARRAFPRIVRDFVRTGKVYYRLRHFPLGRIHPQAVPAAIAAECAAEQEAFWPFKTLLIQNQKTLSAATYRAIARRVGIDADAFERCRSDRGRIGALRRAVRGARRRGVRATPTLFVGDEKFSGAQPYRRLRSAIMAQLNAQDKDAP